jgi:thioredoxin-dependent peroxiredoxin
MNVSVGDRAPQFTLLDQRGEKWALRDQRGRPVVLYFYPRDDTPGCTTQACDVRDHWQEFAALGVEVAGISRDDHHSHAAFTARYGLPHTLLADPDRRVIRKYGAWGHRSMYGRRFEGVIRSSVGRARSPANRRSAGAFGNRTREPSGGGGGPAGLWRRSSSTQAL